MSNKKYVRYLLAIVFFVIALSLVADAITEPTQHLTNTISRMFEQQPKHVVGRQVVCNDGYISPMVFNTQKLEVDGVNVIGDAFQHRVTENAVCKFVVTVLK